MYPDQDMGSMTMNVTNYGFSRHFISSANNTELFVLEYTIAVTSSDVISDSVT